MRKNWLPLLIVFVLCVGIALSALIPTNVLAKLPTSKTKTVAAFNFPKIIPDRNSPLILGGAGETFNFVKTGKTTCGAYVMAESIVPPGEGPPPHIHHFTDEWFYFPDGGITLMHGSNTYPDMKDIPGVTKPKERLHLEKTAPGSIYYGEKNYVHGFINHSKEPKRLTFVWTPDDDKVGISNYFMEVGQKVSDMSNLPAVNPQNREMFVTQAPKYGINQSKHFWQYIDSVDYKFPKMDPQVDRLKALLAPDLVSGTPRTCK